MYKPVFFFLAGPAFVLLFTDFKSCRLKKRLYVVILVAKKVPQPAVNIVVDHINKDSPAVDS
jgi:hypothetical protein